MRQLVKRSAALAALLSAACVQSSDFEPPGEEPSHIVVEGARLDFELVSVWADPDGAELARGKRMVLNAVAELDGDRELKLELDLDEVEVGRQALTLFGAPTLRVLIDGVLYLSRQGEVEIRQGALAHGSTVEVVLRDLGMVDACGAPFDLGGGSLAGVVTAYPEEELGDLIDATGYVDASLDGRTVEPYTFLGPALARQISLSSNGNPAWSVDSWSQCFEPSPWGLKLLLDMTKVRAGTWDMSDDAAPRIFLYRFDEAGTTVPADSYIAAFGEVTLDRDPVAELGAVVAGALTDVELLKFEGSSILEREPTVWIRAARFELLLVE